MNATHTPGPWAYLGDHNRNTDRIVTHEGGEFGREQVALALDFNQFSRDGEADANARLIASAPALLAALLEVKRLRDLWRSQDDAVSIDSIAYMDGLDRINVDAVIAGAKGS